MSMPRHNPKRDAAEPEVVKALEALGFSVERMDRPVDLLAGFRGKCWVIEVKSGDKGYGKTLNANQQKFADGWRGPPVVILRSKDDAIAWAVEVARGMAA